MKFISRTYLNEREKNESNLEHELASLTKCAGTDWCLGLHEFIKREDCVIIVTDLVMGYDLFDFRDKWKKTITEKEGRNILRKLTEAIKGLGEPGRNIVHRDLHLKNVMVHFKNIVPDEDDFEDPVNFLRQTLPKRIRQEC